VVNLPSAAQLRALGVGHLLYVRPSGQALQELDDLNDDFVALERDGIPVRAVGLDDFDRPAVDAGVGAGVASTRYYYGGHPQVHAWFWSYHGWGPAPAFRAGGPRPVMPAQLASRPLYRPSPRPTIFSSRAIGGGSGIGKQKPSGFGRVSVRSSGDGFSARSGSFGRSRSSSSG
jgi:hypothetical protein